MKILLPTRILHRFCLLILAMIITTQCCLDSSEQPGNCTQCPSTQVVVNGSCYDRLKGCMSYRVVNRTTVSCATCQTGYVLYQEKC